MRLLLAARLSRLQANGTQGLGIETQDSRSREWAEHEGHEVVAVAADTKSGTVAPWDRPKLRPWVTDPAMLAQYDGILAYKNDRLSRGVWADEARIRLWAEDNGKVLLIADGPQWPPRHDGDKYSWEGQASAARKEWEECRERSMRAQAKLKEQGKLVGRNPFGYESAGEKYDHHLEPTEADRRYVPEIYARCAAGESLAVVALWLDSEGIASPQGARWSPNRVGALVRNTTYCGRRQDASGKTIHRCPELVDAGLWKRANDNLNSRPGRGRRGATVNERAMLATALFCPTCDGPMYRLFCGTGSSRMPYYRCAGKDAVRRSSCKNMVHVDVVDAAVNQIADRTFHAPVMVTRVKPGTNYEADRKSVV